MSINVTAQERQGLLLNTAVVVEHDDNVLRKIDAIADSAVKLSPEMQYFTQMGKHIFAVNYLGEYSLYKDNSKFNYDNHDISLSALLDHTLKFTSKFKVSYKNEIEEPGINNSTSTLLQQFNKTNKKQAKATFYYGQRQSIGQLVFAINHKESRYTNNLQDYRNLDLNAVTSTFFYRIAPKTRILFQASIADYNYITHNTFPEQSSKQVYYLAGIEWDLTAKTSGTFKVGYQDKDFEQDVYSDISGLSYLLDMSWKPNTYSKIKFAASRTTQESSQQFTSAFVSNSYTLSAEHEITPRTKLEGSYTYNDDQIGNIRNRENRRDDKRNNFVLGITHSLQNWLDVSLDFHRVERTSDFDIYNYKNNIVGLSLTTKFE